MTQGRKSLRSARVRREATNGARATPRFIVRGPAIELKGIVKPVRCYLVRDAGAAEPRTERLIHQEQDGLHLQLDLDRLDPDAAARVLEGVLARLRR